MQHFSLFIAERTRIRKVSPSGGMLIVAGGESEGFATDDSPALDARFSSPAAIAAGPGTEVFVADTGNHRIRTPR